MNAVTSNPLLEEWPGPYGGVPPFDRIRPELFPPAFEAGIDARRAEIRSITDNPAPATFGNTIVPLQDAGRQLSRVNTLFSVMTSNMNTPEYQALDREWSQRLAAASDEITFNEALFARISAGHDDRERAGLTAEQQRLVERIHAQYVRAGAALDASEKEELGRINQQLAGLFSEFASKVLNDENTWIHITDESQLAGLPASLRAAYRAAAEERGLDGWAVVNTRSSVDPFLTFADDRALRERVWTQFRMRGDNDDENDTKTTIAQIVRLRAERGRLLGYESHAHWRMENTMAGTPESTMELMEAVWPAAVARVEEEVALMQEIAAELCDDVWVVAPDGNQSGASHRFTFGRELSFTGHGHRRYAVTGGSPADCVVAGMTHLCADLLPDLVLSGVNNGQNLGDIINCSGTAAGAREGAMQGALGIAMSQAVDYEGGGPIAWDNARRYGAAVVRSILGAAAAGEAYYNVNFPFCPPDEVSGIRVVPSQRFSRSPMRYYQSDNEGSFFIAIPETPQPLDRARQRELGRGHACGSS